jgi:predicted permease
MHTLVSELRYAWRSLRRRPSYFVTCAATLALVLGANAAIFAVTYATMFRPLPFATSGPVVQLYGQPPGTSTVLQRNPLQQMEVPRLRERARTLARLEGFFQRERVVTLAGDPGVVKSAAVTPGLLPMMAMPIVHGRTFTAAEGAPGEAVAIVREHYWRDTLGRVPLGSALTIDGQPHEIVGVLSSAFSVPFIDADVLTPLVASSDWIRAPARTVVGLAEMAPGVSIAQVRDELATISRQLAQESPRTHAFWTLGAEDVREWQYGSMRAPLLMLVMAGALVLLIACVNIANLASAQGVSRSSELAMRVALGASRRDVIRVHVAELLIVGVAGLVPGLLLARVTVPALLAINPTVAQTIGRSDIDWRVQAISLAMALGSAVLASVVPALRATHGQPAAMLAHSGRTTGSRSVIRTQRALVAFEVALCVALLMAGTVVIQGLRELSRRGPGYDAAGVLTAQIRLPEAAYRAPAVRAATVSRLLDEIGALPGVTTVGITQNAFVPKFSYQTLLRVKDQPRADDQPHTVQYRRISPDYFNAMRIATVSGRVFDASDTADRPPVAVISRRFAQALMPGLDPIGRELLRTNAPSLTVVGVVNDAADVTAAEDAEPTLYVPWAQNNNFDVPVAFVIRTSVDPSSLIASVREALKRVDASLPLRKPQPLEVFVAESTAPERFRALVLSILALLGLVLAAVGIAGMTYRSVVDRTKDFAVRLVLGAKPAAVMRLVLSESARDLAIGGIAGLLGGLGLCRLLARSMANVAAIDATTTGVTMVMIGVVGLGAALLPALRVMRVQPAGVLR